MSFVTRDPATGMRHGGIRWPHGTVPSPFGCRWCGEEPLHHGRRWMLRFEQGHHWVRPTNAQILARMKVRRAARPTAVPVCRCDEPGSDPYECEADDCSYPFPELNPFAGAPNREFDAKVTRRCPRCGWTTSSWHVNDGSAEAELHGHVVRAHEGSYERASTSP